jgi:3-oxoacyl-[acyl-carrier-protein] synthase II
MLFPFPKPPARPHRVVITGAGIVTGLGVGWRVNADGFRSGRQALRPVTLFDVSRQRAKIAAEVDLPERMPATQLPPRRLARLDRATRMLILAAHEAWEQSGWGRARSPLRAENIPLVLGTTGGGMSLGEHYLAHALRSPRTSRRQATRVVNYQAPQQALDVFDAFGFNGPITIIANACASGANAVGHAWELVRSGQAPRAMTGGHDALCQLIFAGFDSLQALSATPCRPFDALRNGLTLGEAAAIMTLETLEHARQRGATILGEIIGYAAATDVHHLTQPHPQGDAAFSTMTRACSVAGITPEQVDYINAHGTATPQNDSTEAAAINRWAGARATTLPVSSTKASVGHSLGAAGAVEAVVSLMTLREQWLPPETALETVDPICRFPIVRQPMDQAVNIVLSNSFGFGGANATLIFRRWV